MSALKDGVPEWAMALVNELFGGGEVGAQFAERVLERDFSVFERENIDAVGLDAAAVCVRSDERPLGSAKVALNKVLSVQPLGIRHHSPYCGESRAHRLGAGITRPTGIRATGGLKDAIGAHEAHQRIDVMAVPGIAEGGKRGGSNRLYRCKGRGSYGHRRLQWNE